MASPQRQTRSRRAGSSSRSAQQDSKRNVTLSDPFSLFWIGAICLIHAMGLALLFHPVSALVDTRPLIDQDWGLHFHHLSSLEAFWRQDGRLWGYNPFFMAGYPANTIQDLSSKFFQFAALGLSSMALSPIQWFKLCAFLAMASLPWVIFFAARNFFYATASRNSIATAAALLATVYWWNSLPREMFFYGMIGFASACYFSLLGVSLFYRLVHEAGKFGSMDLAWLLFAAAILPLHVQSVAVCLPPIIALMAVGPPVPGRRMLLWSAGAAALALLINSAWLIPAFEHRADDASAAIVAQLPLFASTHPFTFLLDYLGPQSFWSFRPSFSEKGFRLLLLGLGIVGLRRLLQTPLRALGVSLASAVAALFLLAYFGALVPPVKAWQPLRFKVALDLFLAIGAAYVAGDWVSARQKARARVVPVLFGCGLIAFVINLVQTESTGKLQLRSRLNAELVQLVEWIARETPADGRLLFEESGDETGFVYDGVYLSSLLPTLTGRQLIGGPINLYNDRHHFAEFHSGKIFKQDIQTLSDGALQDYLRLYNIAAIVAFHPASLERLLSIPGLVTVAQRIGPIYLMRVNQPLSWFLAGQGEIKAGFNRLELANLKGSEVILKYHWIEGLSAEPAVRIEAVKMADDPIPFLKLVAPPSNVTLRVGAAN